MRTTLLLSSLLLLVACDWGLGPGPLTLDSLARPPANHATIALTEAVGDGSGRYDMAAAVEYFFPLRRPPPLPELLYDAQIGIGAAVLRLRLGDVGSTGTRTTGSDGVEFLFAAPDGSAYHPAGSCTIRITSPHTGQTGSRLQGETDCAVTDGTFDLRVLVKFDYTVVAD